MTAPATKIAGPWPGKRASKPSKMREPVPLEMLSISDDPPPLRRSQPGGHYDAIFRELRPGQRLICPPDRAHGLAKTLADWLRKRGIKARVRSSEHYPKDGMGGVWYLPPEGAGGFGNTGS